LVNAPGSPDLRVTKSNSTDGEGLVGTPFNWNLTVSNTGTADAVFSSTWAILTDTLPEKIENVSVKVGGFSGITNSDKIDCSLSGSPQVLSCIANGSSVTIASGGNFTVSITSTPTSSGSLINSTAQVDPENHVTESNETNNTATANTVIASSLDPDLSVSKTNNTSNTGATGIPFAWNLSVANTGAGPANFANNDDILTDNLPAGAVYSDISAVISSGVIGTIDCNLTASAPYVINCTASGGTVEIGAGGNFQVSFTAEPDGTSSLANTATVDPEGNVTESNESNNTGSNTVTLAGVTVSGQVRHDTDGDGDLADAESGISGVTIKIYTDPNGDGNPADGSVYATTTTAGDGTYSFINVPPGSYVIVETNPTNHTSTGDSQGSNDDQIAVNLISGTPSTGNDFLDTQPASISGAVYNDANSSGDFDTGELGIQNVTIKLYAADIDGNPTGAALQTTSTDADGHYSFNDVMPGRYVVVETDPAGYESTGDTQGDNDNQLFITLTSGSDSTDNNFFDAQNSGISGAVWVDNNGDGIKQPGETTGIAGVTIDLYTDPNGDGNPADGALVDSTTTDADGNYSFPGVVAGTYVVVQTNLPGYTSTGDKDGGNLDRIAVNLASGTSSTGNDFLDAQPVSISGTVYNDINNSGDFDAGETGIQNVTVKLYAADVDGNPTGVALQTATTDADGAYSFSNVMPGRYVVVETDPSGYTSSGDTQGDNDNAIVIDLTSGSDSTANDFFDAQNGSIGGTVWVDANGDGSKQAGETTGVSGVTIELYTDPNGDGDPTDGTVFDTQTTDTDGTFSFSNIPPGNYVVVETNLSGYTSTGDKDGDNFDQIAVSLSAGDSNTGNDFLDAQAGSINGSVFNDANSSGDLDTGETGIQNVTIKLYAADVDGNPTGAALQTATTDTDGAYTFDNVLPGKYVVVETDPTGYNSTGDTDGDNDNQIVVELSSGSDSTAHDFFDVQISGISGTVWVDDNGDGVKQAGETTGISGVTIELYTDPNGDGDPADGVLVDSVTTDANGEYSFPGIAVGNYVVVQTNLPGYTSTGDKDGGNLDRIKVALSGSSSSSANDFLDAQPGSISGSVIEDANGNGSKDGGETGIGSVTVQLFAADADGNSTGTVLQTATTDANGNYSFANLMPGKYVVVETDPSGYSSTGDSEGDNDNHIVIDLTSGSDNTANDFLDAQFSTISGTVWLDANGDGIKQAGESTGIFGATIKLYAADSEGQANPPAFSAQPSSYMLLTAKGSQPAMPCSPQQAT